MKTGKKIYFVIPVRRRRRRRYSTQRGRGILGNIFNQIGLGKKRKRYIHYQRGGCLFNPKTKAIAKALAKQAERQIIPWAANKFFNKSLTLLNYLRTVFLMYAWRTKRKISFLLVDMIGGDFWDHINLDPVREKEKIPNI